jgi:hypothetical protein
MHLFSKEALLKVGMAMVTRGSLVDLGNTECGITGISLDYA